MADTTYYDLPYPASTGKVSLGYQNIQDLAEQIDEILNDANFPIVGDSANVLRTDTVAAGDVTGVFSALEIGANTITSVELADASVDTAAIVNANVTAAKIESSVALAGSPTTTTQSQSDNSTKIATTAYVDAYITGTVPDDSLTNIKINSAAGIVDTKLATISTASKVSNSATTATSANTVSAIVARDASGNFTAGTITAALTGNATSATTVTTNANLTGDVTSVGNATSIASGVIVDDDVNASAAIAYSKLNLGTSIVNADISASAAIVDTKLATISTASKVSNSATTATDANTTNAIVARDASGNFSAGTITATLTGNVTGNVTGSVSLGFPVTKTADFTVGASENWLICNKSSSCVITLPTPSTDRTIYIKNIAAFTVVSASSNVKPIGTDTAGTAILPATAGTWCTLVSDGTDWIVMQSGPGLFS